MGANAINALSLAERRTPLHLAVSPAALTPNPETVRCLLGLGANPAATDSSGLTPLHIAAMDLTSANTFIPVLTSLPNARSLLLAPDSRGRTALHQACVAGNFPAVQYLAACCNGAALEVKDEVRSRLSARKYRTCSVCSRAQNRCTALVLALTMCEDVSSQEKVVSALLSAGANPFRRHPNGKSILELAEDPTVQALVESVRWMARVSMCVCVLCCPHFFSLCRLLIPAAKLFVRKRSTCGANRVDWVSTTRQTSVPFSTRRFPR